MTAAICVCQTQEDGTKNGDSIVVGCMHAHCDRYEFFFVNSNFSGNIETNETALITGISYYTYLNLSFVTLVEVDAKLHVIIWIGRCGE